MLGVRGGFEGDSHDITTPFSTTEGGRQLLRRCPRKLAAHITSASVASFMRRIGSLMPRGARPASKSHSVGENECVGDIILARGFSFGVRGPFDTMRQLQERPAILFVHPDIF
jgi:hypothetical protein